MSNRKQWMQSPAEEKPTGELLDMVHNHNYFFRLGRYSPDDIKLACVICKQRHEAYHFHIEFRVRRLPICDWCHRRGAQSQQTRVANRDINSASASTSASNLQAPTRVSGTNPPTPVTRPGTVKTEPGLTTWNNLQRPIPASGAGFAMPAPPAMALPEVKSEPGHQKAAAVPAAAAAAAGELRWCFRCCTDKPSAEFIKPFIVCKSCVEREKQQRPKNREMGLCPRGGDREGHTAKDCEKCKNEIQFWEEMKKKKTDEGKRGWMN
ncbi:hypothetical protein QBC43DRAFT_372879 [Cladorrhinum sp. PSN259]|nr:hypothetical protein QBC43DRAFT_372879 [Cladorrhinum sp. PSN259]